MSKAKPVNLKIDWATHDAALYACKNWHYSKCLPAGKLVKLGAWENDSFIGVIIFSRGAAPNLLKPYGLTQYEGCELTRIALTNHSNTVSRILAIAVKFLRKQSPGMKLIVSFADPRQGHHGGVYQASNWIYTGLQVAGGAREYLINGKWVHTKSIGSKLGTQSYREIARRYPKLQHRPVTRKLRYLFSLDDKLKIRIMSLAKPYPKRASSVESGTSDYQSERGGESPTDALQLNSDISPAAR